MKNLNPLFEAIKDLSMDYPKPGWFTRTFRPEKAKRMQQDRDDVAKRVKGLIGRPNHVLDREATHNLTRADAYTKAAKCEWADKKNKTFAIAPNRRRSNNGKLYKGETRLVPYKGFVDLLKK